MEMLRKIILLVIGVWFSPVIIAWYFLPRWAKRWMLLKLMDLFDEQYRPQPYERYVLPHDGLVQHYENLWSLQGSLPERGPKFARAMMIYRIPGTSSLVVHSPICVREEVVQQIESLGEVSMVIVPNRGHRLDCGAWAQRYPKAKFLTPSFAMKYVKSRVPTCHPCEQEFPHLSLSFQSIPAGKSQPNIRYVKIGKEDLELAYVLKLEGISRPHGFAIVVCDALFNLDKDKAHWVTRLIGSAEGFGVTKIGTILMEHPRPMLDWMCALRDYAQALPIDSIFMAHGAPIIGNEKVIVKLNEAIYRFTKSI